MRTTVYTRVDYSKFEELSSYDEVINSDLSLVPIPVLHLNEQLLWAAQGHIIPVGQTYPVVLIWISKAFSVVLPSPEEVICWFAEIASSLQHRPAAPMCIHVAVDIDCFASEGDRVSAARCLSKSKLVGAGRGGLFLWLWWRWWCWKSRKGKTANVSVLNNRLHCCRCSSSSGCGCCCGCGGCCSGCGGCGGCGGGGCGSGCGSGDSGGGSGGYGGWSRSGWWVCC